MKATYEHLAKGGQVEIELSFGRKTQGVPVSVGNGQVTIEVNGQRITRDEWRLV